MQQLYDKKELKKVQEYFCTLTHLFAYCIDGDGNKITGMSGEEAGLEVLARAIPEGEFYQIYKRIADSALEDMIVQDTRYDNVKLAAVCIHKEGRKNKCWLICCVLNDVTQGELLDIPVQGTDMDSFYTALDLMAYLERKDAVAADEILSAKAESRRSRSSETKMEKHLRRTEAMTEIVQFLVGSDAFEEVGNEIMRITGEYLGVSGAKLFQVSRDGAYVDMICHWQNPDAVFDLDKTHHLPKGELLSTDKPLIVSADTLLSVGMRGEMMHHRLKALAVLPVFVGNQPAMYFCLHEQDNARSWQLDDIRFANDAAKILQSLLNRRIQKKSLAGSYASLQEILDNVGTCIYVKDAETGRGLFSNKLLKHIFEKELSDNTFGDILENARPMGVRKGFYEVEYSLTGRWYDLYHVSIGWIDGRQVELYALYDITDKKIYQKKIEQQAYTDYLTGLYNRLCCERDLAVQIDKAKQTGKKGALLYMDLDDFKHINDGLGHEYGDVLLQNISHAFRRVEGVEESCYRMGGDEFVIIIPPESYDRFSEIVEDIRGIFDRPWYLKDGDYYCTMSMGICSYPDEGESVSMLIKKADIAMYDAKKKGKNRVAQYSESMNHASGRRLDMEKNMRNATNSDCNEFKVYFQPIIDIRKEGNPCTGAEALVRWNSAALGFIPPSDFIPLAEYLGLIIPIGNYVLREACYACRYWNENGHPEFKVNVNLSVVQLLQTDIVEVIDTALQDTGINPRNLTLEVTESLAINDMQLMKRILNDIRALGVRIALDDFGTGYSSLNHIREIPLDVIKVDQSFVKDLAQDSYSQSFIKMVAELAAAINVSICIEGIETKEQYEVLEGMKARLVQGYYFDKPLPREEFERKYVE